MLGVSELRYQRVVPGTHMSHVQRPALVFSSPVWAQQSVAYWVSGDQCQDSGDKCRCDRDQHRRSGDWWREPNCPRCSSGDWCHGSSVCSRVGGHLGVRDHCGDLIAGLPLDGPVIDGVGTWSQWGGLPPRGVGSTGIAKRSFTDWNASSLVGTMRCRGPLLHPGVGGGSGIGLKTCMGEDTPMGTGGPTWVLPGLLHPSYPPLVLASSPFDMCLLRFLLGHWRWYQEDGSAGEALHTEVNILSTETNQPGSNAILNINCIRSALNLMPQSFLVQGLNPLQILHLSFT